MNQLNVLEKWQIREIRKRFGKNSSTIIVLGAGCVSDYMPTYLEDNSVCDLQSKDLNRLYDKWSELLDIQKEVEENAFLASYFDELAAPLSLANTYIVNNSPVSVIPPTTTSRIKVVDLWGNVSKGIDRKSGRPIDVKAPIERSKVASLFPDSVLTEKKRSVSAVEDAFVTDQIGSVLIVGASGLCPVTESLFNRSLVKKVPVIVVNSDPDCYMHSLAHLSFKCSAQDFFHDLKMGFKEYDACY